MRAIVLAALIMGSCLALARAEDGRLPPRTPVPAEIAHGIKAAAQCESESWSTEDYSSCLDAAVAQAMEHDSASMSFQLGTYCSGFYKLALADRTQAWKQSIVHSDAAEAATVDQLDSCLFAARPLGLAAVRLCTALNLPCDDFNRVLRYWQQVSGQGM